MSQLNTPPPYQTIPKPYQTIPKEESRRKRQEEVRGCKRKYEMLEEGRGPRVPRSRGPKDQDFSNTRIFSFSVGIKVMNPKMPLCNEQLRALEVARIKTNVELLWSHSNTSEPSH